MVRKVLAEFLGTMFLVIFGCGSAVAVGQMANTGYQGLLISFAFGLIIVAMAYSVGNISGCHINPAVSLGMLVAGRMRIADFIGYIIAQFLGGIAGAAVLAAFFDTSTGLGSNGYGANSSLGIELWQALLIEVILTFVFIFTILGVTDKTENTAVTGLVIGLTLTLIHILGIPFTGTSVNPARSFGPALLAQGTYFPQVWVFIVAPLVGAALAAIAYRFLAPKKNI